MSPPRLPLADPEFLELLRLSTLTIATAGPGGEPHAAAVYFVAGGISPGEAAGSLRFYFFSDRHSQHAQDTARNPHAAIEIHPQVESWQDIRGLQMRGQVFPVEPGMEWESAWALYRLRFPFVSEMKLIVARNSLYRFEPDWIRLVNNRRRFGYKQEWILP